MVELRGSLSPGVQSGHFQVVPHTNSKLNNSHTGFKLNFENHMENFKKIRKQFIIDGNLDFDVN